MCAAAHGARNDRFVWIDIFAVRQWPGNGADLDFRRVIDLSDGIIVAVSRDEEEEVAILLFVFRSPIYQFLLDHFFFL